MNLDEGLIPQYFPRIMKSCFSILIALLILVVFLGTAGVIMYGSSTTKFEKGTDADSLSR